jgi:selenocysteine lyase/cysteine desulfurase
MATPPEPELFKYIREHELGADLTSQTPFGSRPLIYADYTASGRSLAFIEDYVRDGLLPTYGNTHTSTTKTGRQSSDFVAEARTIVKNYLRCNDKGKNADRLLFAGSGATAGANRVVAMLGLTAPTVEAREAAALKPEHERPLVLVGPHEHHSNLLPWRDSIAEVRAIPEDPATGGTDLAALEAALKAATAARRPLVVGAFSAASNVTGILAAVDAITLLLHTHGALAIWDYASAAPYGVSFAMNPPHEDAETRALLAKDAMFFSPHKFAGGKQ